MAGVLDDSMASLPNLPTDILLLIFNTLSVRELSALSQTSSFFHDLVCAIYLSGI
jgi:F-box-like